jgi:formate hydrogenlyase transcriptional activator
MLTLQSASLGFRIGVAQPSGAAMNVASLQKVALAVTESQAIGSVLETIVRVLAEQREIVLARIWLIGPGDICSTCDMKNVCPDQRFCLHLAASMGNPLRSDRAEQVPEGNWTRIDGHFRRIPLNAPLKIGYIGGTGQPVLLRIQKNEEMHNWIARPDWVTEQQISSFAGQPLIFRGEILGVLGLFSRAHISDQEFAWLRALADVASLAIANARALEESKKTADELQLQLDVLQNMPAVAWTVTPDGRMDFINRLYLEATGQSYESCVAPLEDWNKSGSELPPFLAGVHPAHKERAAQIFWNGIRSGQGWVLEAPYLHSNDGRYHWHMDRAVPLRDKQGKIVRFIGTCSDIEELKQAEGRNKTLLEISNAMVGNLPQQALLPSICEALQRVVSFEWAGLALYQTETDTFRLLAVAGERTFGHFQPGRELDRKASSLGWVFDQRRPLVRRDLEKGQHYADERYLVEAGVRSHCIVPLVTRGNCLGVLAIASATSGRFSDADAEFLAEVANQVALAVANTKAYEEIAFLKARLERENTYLQEEIRREHNFEEIVGNSPELLKLLDKVESAAPTNANVLITGETGSGKELIARAIHSRSNRRGRPLVKVNCGAIPAGLVESELFGHVKGAFTGASESRIGRFELADGGTLFLDEIGELSLDTQVKLLRVLQEQEFEPVGSNRTIRVNVRIIAATNRELEKTVKAGQFRSDLYYRLNVIPLRVPSLRERRSDIPQMVMFFLEQSAKKIGKETRTVSQQTMKLLVDYTWPGNIRELQNIIERGVVLSRGPVLKLGPDLLPLEASDVEEPTRSEAVLELDASASLRDVEKLHILAVLEKTGWVISGPTGAGAILNVHPNTLRSLMKRLGIQRGGHGIS